MSYSVHNFGTMLFDHVRREAYLEVIRRLAPGSRVLDLGAGTGFFSIAALNAGADHVVAVDLNSAVNQLTRVLKTTPHEARCEILNTDIREIELEPFDLIIADLRGPTPFYGDGLQVMSYARQHLLTENGRLIPEKDELMASVVSLPNWYRNATEPWMLPGADWSSYRDSVLSTPTSISTVNERTIFSQPVRWQCIDYSDTGQLEKRKFGSQNTIAILQSGLVHGVLCWFETMLTEDIGYSTEPSDHKPTYGRLLLPFLTPVSVSIGQECDLTVQCFRLDKSWTWDWGVSGDSFMARNSSVGVGLL